MVTVISLIARLRELKRQRTRAALRQRDRVTVISLIARLTDLKRQRTNAMPK